MPSRPPRYARPPSMSDYGRGGGYEDDSYYRGGGSPVTSLIMEQGRQRANSELMEADIWGNAASTISNTLSEGFKGFGEHLAADKVKKDEKAKATREKEMEDERNASLNKLIESGQPIMPKDFISIYGFERGSKMAGTWSELVNKEKKVDPQKFAIGFDAADEKTKSQTWPAARQRFLQDYGATTPELQKVMPENWEEGGRDYWAHMKPHLLPKAELMAVNPGDVVIDKNNPGAGAQFTAPPKLQTPSFRDVETAGGIRPFDTTTGTMGPVLAQAPPKQRPGGDANPAVADRVADDWASGLVFPSTQSAKAEAQASFARRGLPTPRMLSVAMQQDAIRQTETVQSLEDIASLYEHVKDKVGPANYRLAELGQNIPGIEADPAFAEFNAALRTMGNLEVKRITGSQMSADEATRLLKGMATGTLKPAEFEQVLGFMHRNAKRQHQLLMYGPDARRRDEKAQEPAAPAAPKPGPQTPAGTRPIPPGAKPGQGRKGPIIVKTPGGDFPFPDEASAAAFRKEAGL